MSKPGKDVWSHLYTHCNADVVKYSETVDGQGQDNDARFAYQTPSLTGRTFTLGSLVRHLPELGDDILFAAWGHPFSVRADAWQLTRTTGPPVTQTCSVMLRHNHDAATKAMIVDREKDLLKTYTKTLDVFDVVSYSASATTPPGLNVPITRMDVFGEPYMDFRRTNYRLSELCLYHTALFILSSLIRYDAEQWKRLLDDHPSEGILIDRFLDLAIRKLPNLAVNDLAESAILFCFAR